MSRVYTVSFPASTFASASGDYDFFELTPAANKSIQILAICIGQKSEVGDAQEEFVEWSIVTDNATTGNGASATPRPVDSADTQAAGFLAEVIASTPASAGTEIFVHQDTFNIRAGLNFIVPERMQAKVSSSDTMLCIRMEQGLADDASVAGTVYVLEL